jgi:hypothetical protein
MIRIEVLRNGIKRTQLAEPKAKPTKSTLPVLFLINLLKGSDYGQPNS